MYIPPIYGVLFEKSAPTKMLAAFSSVKLKQPETDIPLPKREPYSTIMHIHSMVCTAVQQVPQATQGLCREATTPLSPLSRW